jgi:uncharacterized protein (TIGR00730 family)
MPTNERPQPDSFEQLHDEPPDAYHPPSLEQLVQQMRETADKLLRDHATRGDVKLLNTALKELRYAFKIFSAYRNLRKVTVFGSARLPSSHPAYRQAVLFGEKIAAAGFMVITGAASGIMEAGHVGAGREKSIGVNILLPFEQEANPVIRGDLKLMHLRYFFTRKLLFIKEADAVVLFPGGFGTLDEGFEALTLVQTGKSQLLPVVLVDEPGGTYWALFEQFIRETLLKNALISPSDMHLFRRTDNVDEAVDEVLTFYRVYHSMRYVRGGRLVLRLKQELSESLLEKIRAEFDDILASGTFEQTDALPEEANDTHAASLKRLKFHFDRKNVGRLRQLVDVINREG